MKLLAQDPEHRKVRVHYLRNHTELAGAQAINAPTYREYPFEGSLTYSF